MIVFFCFCLNNWDNIMIVNSFGHDNPAVKIWYRDSPIETSKNFPWVGQHDKIRFLLPV